MLHLLALNNKGARSGTPEKSEDVSEAREVKGGKMITLRVSAKLEEACQKPQCLTS